MNLELKYKDLNPVESIKKFKEILFEFGIELNENWLPKSSINTYSVRLTLKDNNLVGTNGKGVTRDLALASAYGEFFERWQNKFLAIDYKRISNNYRFFYDEKYISADQLLEQEDGITKLIIDGKLSKDKAIELYNKKLSYYSENGKYLCTPFLNLTKNKTEYLPIKFIRNTYGSNGMCSGNNPYEALVQGISEIFERKSIYMALNGKKFKDIDINLIFNNKDLLQMYELIDKSKIKVIFKDCSLLDSCKVVCGIFIDKENGTYGINFGAHPDFRIAISRVLTEATQGQDIYKFAQNSTLDFNNKKVRKMYNFYNVHALSRGDYPYQFLISSKNDKKNIFCNEVFDNKELFFNIITELTKKGFEVYIKDVSVTEIPAYHIIIPGMSELVEYNSEYQKIINTKFYVNTKLSKTSELKKDDVKYIKFVLSHFLNYFAYRKLNTYYNRRDNYKYFLEDENLDALFLLGLCHLYLKEFSRAEKIFNKIKNKIKDEKSFKIITILISYSQLRIKKNYDETISIIDQIFEGIPEFLLENKDDNFINYFIPDDIDLDKSKSKELIHKLYNSKYIEDEINGGQKSNERKIKELFDYNNY